MKEHQISYSYRSYRCRWHCTCGACDKSYTVAKYVEARNKAAKHLESLDLDTKSLYK